MHSIRVMRELKIRYAEPAGVPLLLDVARPEQAAGLPVLLLVHGGGWCSGDRSKTSAAAQRLARAGYVTVNIEHRLAPAHPFPAATDDVRAAIDWIRQHIGDYGGDPSRLGGLGISSGGHLLALIATMKDSPLACAATWGSPMDLRQDPVTPPYRSYPLAFLGACRHDDPIRYQVASPLCRLSPHSAPLLLIHGSDDDVVPVAQCRNMALAAERVGARVETLVLPDFAHAPTDPRDPAMATAEERMRAFFARHLQRVTRD